MAEGGVMPRRRKGRIYWRQQGGKRRYYLDARDYRDVGGGQEALIAGSEWYATTDRDVADALASARIKELDAKRRGRALHGRAEGTKLAEYAATHLEKKRDAGRVTTDWIEVSELFLKRAVAFFGADRDLESISAADVHAWATHLATTPLVASKRKAKKGEPPPLGRCMTNGTVRHHLNALSNLYARAQSEGRVPPGFSPVAALLEKPTGRRLEARWLEIHEGSLLLESARRLPALPDHADALPAAFAYPLVGTFLLTGGRQAEVLGLEVEDVSFDRKTVTIRPNGWRRLKTLKSARVVPLWPQLEEILRPWVFGTDRPPGRLLFPSFLTGREAMLTDWRGTLDRVAVRAGWKRARFAQGCSGTHTLAPGSKRSMAGLL